MPRPHSPLKGSSRYRFDDGRIVVGGIRNLRELAHQGGSIRAVCRECSRVSIFAPFDLASYFSERRWSDGWPEFAERLRCAGCGARNPIVAWTSLDPPPRPSSPPRPRSTRTNNVIKYRRPKP